MPKLTIRLKTFFGISFTLTLLIVCLGLSIRHINAKNVRNIEQEMNRTDLQQAIDHLQHQQQQLNVLASRLVASKALANLIANDITNSFDVELLNMLNIDLILIVDSHNKLLYQSKQGSLKSAQVLTNIQNNYPQILAPHSVKRSHVGTIIIDQQPVSLAAHTFSTNNKPTQLLAKIILVQPLDKKFWSATHSRATFTTHLIATPTANKSPQAAHYITEVINDINGAPLFTLTSHNEALIRKQAKEHLFLFLLVLLVTGGTVILITQIILDKLVLSRLHILSNELKMIGADSQPTITVKGDDEISMITLNIKEMLNRLDVGKKQQEQQEQRFADMIEHSGQVVIAMNQQGEITLFNHSAELTTGYQREDVLGTSFVENFISAEAANHLQSYIEEAVKNNQFTGNFLIPIRTRNAVVRNISWDAIIERNATDNSITFIGFGRDVTEQHAIEQQLQLVNTVFNNTAEAIMISDADNNIIEINPSFAKLSGYSEQELIGQNPRLLKSDVHDSVFFENMWKEIINTGHWEGEIWDKSKQGNIYPKRMSVVTIPNPDGSIKNFFSVSTDITKAKEDEAKLHQLAYFDSLTDLPNRLSFCHHIEKRLLEKTPFSVAILNICNFKQINETIGPVQADILLKRVAERLQHSLLDGVYLARMGGDEFSYCVPSELREKQRGQIIEAIKAPIALEARRLTLDINLGISRSPEHGECVDELIKNASIALYSNKGNQHEIFSLFHHSMNEQIAARLALTEMLREAINRDEFEVYYQPKILVTDGSIVGAEALIRWHSRDGMIPPDLFIPIAEETGLIRPIGEWVLREACRQASEWRKTNPTFHMAVNISPAQFDHEYLPQLVNEVLEQSSLPAKALELEITEGMIIDNVESTIEILQSLQELGIELSIDDFGTGYSSLSYLTRLPLDILKIDRSFMEKVPASQDDTNVVLSILALASSLKLRVTAEGVETQEHVDLLREHNCDYIQGYFYSRPLPAKEFHHYMTKKHQQETIQC